ncbi:2-keto-4-pentenoate hydratase [Paraburkholderia lycopersici]|uniref:2-keto-4-pentenoate hydratase n=1 Tax=Paraburkholderia lycopersici TaxID=416944 RepID=A0A1G6IPU2_9BURK|nr:fumarylacetoacetate hydrolase family protein [Paraburkholderia lycopersici]SDC08508.1 2-keto-4-pentenoate hydratase [Paraburkholderia lycopersici]
MSAASADYGTPMAEKAEALAAQFVAARTADGTASALDTIAPALRPSTEDEAYDVQQATVRALGGKIGGWKVGAKSPDGPIQGAPLPSAGVFRQPVTLRRASFAKVGLELEVAFTFGRRFEPHSGPYDDATVVAAIASVHAAIEVVSSRFRAWPDVDKLWQLADLQNHGALVVGEGVAYDAAWPFVAPAMRFAFDGASAFDGTPANPAGDPRRLLAWVVNHAVSRGVAIEPGTVLTTGSYTGLFFASSAGVARGEIPGLPPIEVTLV